MCVNYALGIYIHILTGRPKLILARLAGRYEFEKFCTSFTCTLKILLMHFSIELYNNGRVVDKYRRQYTEPLSD